MENADSTRLPYSVRKARLRQAKLAEAVEPLAPVAVPANKEVQIAEKSKDTKAYVVEVQIPVTPEPILLQSKFPSQEPTVINFSQSAAPEPVVNNGLMETKMASSVKAVVEESIQHTEPEFVAIEEKLVTEVNTVVEAAPPQPAQQEPMAMEAPSSILSEPVMTEAATVVQPEPVVAEAATAVQPEPVVAEAATTVQPEPVVAEAATTVQLEPVVVETATTVQPEPVAVQEPPSSQPEVGEAPVQAEIIKPQVEDEALATPVIKEEIVSVVEKEPESLPKVEAPSVPIEEVQLIPAAVRQKVLDLIYWRDVKKTGVVFGSMLFIFLSLAIFSVLSVVAYLSLAILAVTLSFRVYKNIMQAVQKSGEGHPFKEYLEWDIELTDQKTQKVVKLVMKHFNATVRELRRLFLVEDLVDSIKFGLLLWVLTYIGSWFNGMTLIINSVIVVFTLPKIYETYKVQIDNYLAMARSQFNKILLQVQSKLPFLKKKAKAQ